MLGRGDQRDLVVGVTVNPVHHQIHQIRCPEWVFAIARTPHRRIAGGAGDSSDAICGTPLDFGDIKLGRIPRRSGWGTAESPLALDDRGSAGTGARSPLGREDPKSAP